MLLRPDAREFGQTGNQIREFFHAFDMARDENATIFLTEEGFPMKVLREIFLGLEGGTPYWKERAESLFGVKVIDQLNDDNLIESFESWEYIQKTVKLFRYRSTRHTLEQRKNHRRYLLQNLYQLTAHEMMLNPHSQSTTALCSSLYAFFGVGEKSGDDQSTSYYSYNITDKYTVIHSRYLLRLGALAEHKLGVDSQALTNMPPDFISAILSPLGMLNNSIIMISDGQNIEAAERLSLDTVVGPVFQLVPSNISSMVSDMVRKRGVPVFKIVYLFGIEDPHCLTNFL